MLGDDLIKVKRDVSRQELRLRALYTTFRIMSEDLVPPRFRERQLNAFACKILPTKEMMESEKVLQFKGKENYLLEGSVRLCYVIYRKE